MLRAMRSKLDDVPCRSAERLALAAGAGGLVFGSALTAAAALVPPPDPDRVMPASSPHGAIECPDGWAWGAALRDGVSEAEMTARYVSAVFSATDRAVLRAVDRHLRAGGGTPAEPEAQIALCVALSRGLV